MSESC